MASGERSRVLGCLSVVGGLLLLCLLYILSIGPAAYVADKIGAENRVRQLYGPVIWLHDNTILEKPLEFYVELFGVH